MARQRRGNTVRGRRAKEQFVVAQLRKCACWFCVLKKAPGLLFIHGPSLRFAPHPITTNPFPYAGEVKNIFDTPPLQFASHPINTILFSHAGEALAAS